MNLQPVFNKYGRSASLCTALGVSEAAMNAIISPLRYKNKMYLYGVNTDIGYNSQGHYLYLGPATPDITAVADGQYILCDSKKYRIDRAEKVYIGNTVFYIWAIIREIVEIEEEDDDE